MQELRLALGHFPPWLVKDFNEGRRVHDFAQARGHTGKTSPVPSNSGAKTERGAPLCLDPINGLRSIVIAR